MTYENSEMNCSEFWENYLKTTKEDDWIEICELQKLAARVPFSIKTNASTAVESYCDSCKVALDSRRPLTSVDL